MAIYFSDFLSRGYFQTDYSDIGYSTPIVFTIPAYFADVMSANYFMADYSDVRNFYVNAPIVSGIIIPAYFGDVMSENYFQVDYSDIGNFYANSPIARVGGAFDVATTLNSQLSIRQGVIANLAEQSDLLVSPTLVINNPFQGIYYQDYIGNRYFLSSYFDSNSFSNIPITIYNGVANFDVTTTLNNTITKALLTTGSFQEQTDANVNISRLLVAQPNFDVATQLSSTRASKYSPNVTFDVATKLQVILPVSGHFHEHLLLQLPGRILQPDRVLNITVDNIKQITIYYR